MVEITLLGRVAVVVDGEAVTGEAAQRRRIALLALLAVPPLRPVSRDRLMLYLWPDNDTESARHLLSVAVHVLRKALGHDALVATADEIALNPALCHSDVGQFEQALRDGDAETAVALYGGPFMDGFHVGTGPELEQWLDGERARLQREYASALEAVAHVRRGAGDLDGAVAAWRSIAVLDPYSSQGALGLMRALADAGNRVAAIRHASVHRQLLRSELEAEPDAQVEALAEELRHPEGSEPEGFSPAPVAKPAAPGPAPAPPVSAAIEEPGKTVATRLSTNEAPQVKDGQRATSAGAASRAPLRLLRLLRRPVYALALVVTIGLGAFIGGWFVSSVRGHGTMQTLAVLPCVNRTPGGDADFLADAVPDQILTELGTANVKRLRVVPRNSSFALGPRADVREMRRRFPDVDLVLSCAVERSGDLVGINVELASTGEAITKWNRRYESHVGELFALKESIARAVTQELFGRSAGPGGQEARPPDPVAFTHFLQGRHAWYQRSPRALEVAATHFRAAVTADPGYALFWAALAETYVVAAGYDYAVLEPTVAYPLALAAAQKAIELDPENASAHAALAAVYKDYDGDLRGAELEFRRAIELNPRYSTARQWYSLLLVVTHRNSEALAQVQKAAEEEPASAAAMVARAHEFYYVRDYARADSAIRQALAMDSTFGRAHLLLALIEIQLGQVAEARARLEAMRARAPEPVVVATLGYAYAREGQREKALACRRSLEQTALRRYVPAELFAMLDVGLGDHDSAIRDLEEMRRRRSNGSVYLGIEPIMDPLRSDPRFQRLLAASPAARAGNPAS